MLAGDVIRVVAPFLKPKWFRELKLTCKSIYKNMDRQCFWQNAHLQTEHICYLVFDKGENVFITGPGGTGKSFTLRKILKIAAKRKIKAAATATTGSAATNFDGGRTIHSFSGLKTGHEPYDSLVKRCTEKPGWTPGRKNWNTHELLIIDEISMLGGHFLDKINLVAGFSRNNRTQPFGGMQFVFCGDFLQLQPIGDIYAFESDIWKKMVADKTITTIKMETSVRQQNDPLFSDLLKRIRNCTFTDADVEKLKQRIISKQEAETKFEGLKVKPTQIYCKNKEVEELNEYEFNKLTTPIEFTSHAIDHIFKKVPTIFGKMRFEPSNEVSIEEARKYAATNLARRAPTELKFRVGAQLILTYNIDVAKKLVNGSRCVYVGGGKAGELGNVRLLDGREIKVEKILQRFPAGKNHEIRRLQYPLKYGWACTTHACQGYTLELALLDIGSSIFSNSQAYVALSRVRSLQSLYILNFDETRIRANSRALDFYATKSIPKISAPTSSTSSSSKKRAREADGGKQEKQERKTRQKKESSTKKSTKEKKASSSKKKAAEKEPGQYSLLAKDLCDSKTVLSA